MASLSIRPTYLTLEKLFTNRVLRIPEYQRAYSWEAQQRNDLFEDISLMLSKRGGSEHFMATVVALRRKSHLIGGIPHVELEIVDGQQRLTTFVVLLKAIEKRLNRKDKSEGREAKSLSELLVKKDGKFLLLQTNHDTSHYFVNYIRSGAAPEPSNAKTIADRCLLEAIAACEQFVELWKKKKKLVTLLSSVLSKITFVLHETDNEAAVYSIFEVLNSRGLDVSWLDRLKSILMGSVFEFDKNREETIRELRNVWKDIYARVGLRIGMSSEALRYTATLMHKTAPNKLLNERDAVEFLRGIAKDNDSVISVANGLLSVTVAYDDVVASRRLQAVTRISQARLLATAIILRGDINELQREDLLTAWEKVSFRIYGMMDYDARKAVGEYVRLAWRVSNSKLKYAQILEGIVAIGSSCPIKDAVDNLRNGDCYSEWKESLRYLLWRYEEHLATERNQHFNQVEWEKIWLASAAESIEHIWPQDSAPARQKHRLGNLLLLPPRLNSQLGNKSPQLKKDSYRRSGLLIAQAVADRLSKPWDKDQVDKREAAILKWVAKAFAD